MVVEKDRDILVIGDWCWMLDDSSDEGGLWDME